MKEPKPGESDRDQTKSEDETDPEELLDEALEETFPASDPPALTLPRSDESD